MSIRRHFFFGEDLARFSLGNEIFVKGKQKPYPKSNRELSENFLQI